MAPSIFMDESFVWLEITCQKKFYTRRGLRYYRGIFVVRVDMGGSRKGMRIDSKFDLRMKDGQERE